MSPNRNQRDIEFYAATYDACVPDWPGEIVFYQEMVAAIKANGGAMLEVTCGTGRVAARLAIEGMRVVGLDLSAEMLAIARQKAAANIAWVQTDMRSFELGEQFDLMIIPGHSFQNLNSSADQLACLESIKRHLIPGGSLVVHLDHQDFGWLGDLVGGKGGVFETAEQFTNPATGRLVHTSRAWSYQPATQTAICQTVWEKVDDKNQVLER